MIERNQASSEIELGDMNAGQTRRKHRRLGKETHSKNENEVVTSNSETNENVGALKNRKEAIKEKEAPIHV